MVDQGSPLPGLACETTSPAPSRASETPRSLVLSLQDVPGHRQQGQQVGLAHVLDLAEPLLVLGARHVFLELLQQAGARKGREE